MSWEIGVPSHFFLWLPFKALSCSCFISSREIRPEAGFQSRRPQDNWASSILSFRKNVSFPGAFLTSNSGTTDLPQGLPSAFINGLTTKTQLKITSYIPRLFRNQYKDSPLWDFAVYRKKPVFSCYSFLNWMAQNVIFKCKCCWHEIHDVSSFKNLKMPLK